MSTQYSGQYAQGLVAAAMAELSPKMAKYYSDWTVSQNQMSKISVDAATFAGWSQFASGMAQAGMSALSAGTSFVSAGSATTYLNEVKAANTQLENTVKPIDNELEALKNNAQAQLNPNQPAGGAAPNVQLNVQRVDQAGAAAPAPGAAAQDAAQPAGGNRQVQVDADQDAQTNPSATNKLDKARKEELLRQRQDAQDKFNLTRDNARAVMDRAMQRGNVVSHFGQVAGQAVNGTAQQTVQVEQAKGQVATTSGNSAASAREEGARAYNEWLNGLQGLFSYAQALSR